jgi:hypothetical protein
VLFRAGTALITTDVTFTRGDWRGGELEVFVAYGAPGVPTAFDAHLLALEPGRLLPPEDARGQGLGARHAQRRPPGASHWIGPPSSAGQLVRLPGAALELALGPSGLGALRLREVHAFRPAEGGRRSLLVRVSRPGGGPMPVGALTVRGEGVTLDDVSAARCPAGADEPLVVSGRQHPQGARPPPRAPRGADDELCVTASVAARPR